MMAQRLLRHPVLNPVRSLNETMRAHPIKTSVVVTTVKAGLADLLVQTTIERRREVDERRLATFVVFGGVYQGCFQYWLFNVAFERLFPGHGLLPTVKKILAVNMVGDPVFFFPCFYTLKEALQCKTFRDAMCLDTARRAMANYYRNCFDDWRNTWATWLPGHTITYGVLPMHLRMPWVAAVSFFYLSLLSFTRGSQTSQLPPPSPSHNAARQHQQLPPHSGLYAQTPAGRSTRSALVAHTGDEGG